MGTCISSRVPWEHALSLIGSMGTCIFTNNCVLPSTCFNSLKPSALQTVSKGMNCSYSTLQQKDKHPKPDNITNLRSSKLHFVALNAWLLWQNGTAARFSSDVQAALLHSMCHGRSDSPSSPGPIRHICGPDRGILGDISKECLLVMCSENE